MRNCMTISFPSKEGRSRRGKTTSYLSGLEDCSVVLRTESLWIGKSSKTERESNLKNDYPFKWRKTCTL